MSDDIDSQWMDDFLRRQEVREAERQAAILESKTDFIANDAWLCWSKGDLRFFLVESPVWVERERLKKMEPEMYALVPYLAGMAFGRFNGYVRFPKLPTFEPGTRGILTYVPVHGGITFFQEWWDGSVTYGFDTAHACSDDIPEIISAVDWMMNETESLGRGIQIAARFERFYLNALDDNKRKARVLDRMGQFLPLDIGGNVGVMLNLLRGEL